MYLSNIPLRNVKVAIVYVNFGLCMCLLSESLSSLARQHRAAPTDSEIKLCISDQRRPWRDDSISTD